MTDVTKPIDSIVTGLSAVAEHFGRSERQVRRWLREGMPRLSQKRFDLLQIQAWLDARQGIRPPAGPGYVDPKQLSFIDQGGSGKDFHEERLKKAKADEAEIRVKQLRTELIPRAEISSEVRQRHIGLKQGLLVLQRSLPPRLIHCQNEREMEIILGQAVRELLVAWSRPFPERLGGVIVDDPDLPEGGGKIDS